MELSLPFEIQKVPEGHDHSNLENCELYRSLPEEVKAEIQKNPFLLEHDTMDMMPTVSPSWTGKPAN